MLQQFKILQISEEENLMSKTYQKNGFHSPRWLAYPEHWPEQKEITLAKESEKEVKMIKELVCIATEKSEKNCQLLKIFEFQEVIQITSWIYRFFEH